MEFMISYLNWFINKLATQDSDQAISAHSIDYDGCYAHWKTRQEPQKSLIEHNTVLIEHIKKTDAASKTILMVGSARQCEHLDTLNARFNQNGSCFVALKELSEYLKVELDPFLLADISGNLCDGASFMNAIDPDFNGTHFYSYLEEQ